MNTEILIFRSPAVFRLYDLVRVTYDEMSNIIQRERLLIGLTFEDASNRLESGNF